ncbi:MAG: hypothetical protein H7061_12215 [Bdellovibrionaceae bacterium]|nr:hypothetical protein [Bdellovibrio sp.]
MPLLSLFLLFISISWPQLSSGAEAEVKKTHLEDIFIWKMSDELKLSAKDEKKFTEIQKDLNKKKSELNREIQASILTLAASSETSSINLKVALKRHRELLVQYNQLGIIEFDLIKKLLGERKFANYLEIKSELTSKVKSLLIGEKDKKEPTTTALPTPKIIIEKNSDDP